MIKKYMENTVKEDKIHPTITHTWRTTSAPK